MAYNHGVRVHEREDQQNYIKTIESSSIGMVCTADDADATLFPLNEPVMLSGYDETTLSQCGTTGTLLATLKTIADQGYAPLTAVVRVASDTDPALQAARVVDGVAQLAKVAATYDFKPRCLAAPGLDQDNSVIHALTEMADKLKAFVYADLNAVTADDALIERQQFRSKRLMLLWPAFTRAGVVVPASAVALGLRARIDNDHPLRFAKAIDNVSVNNVDGVTVLVDWDWQSSNNTATLLNANHITTLVRQGGRYRLWGGRTASTSPNWFFEPAVRTADAIDTLIAEAQFERIGAVIDINVLEDMVEDVRSRLGQMKRTGLIYGFNIWLDEQANTAAALESGAIYVSYDFTPVKMMEQINFISIVTNKYLLEAIPGWLSVTSTSPTAQEA